MLTERRVGVLVYILENKDMSWSINAVSKALNLTYPTCYEFIHDLLKRRLVKKNNGDFSVTDIENIIEYIGVSYPFVSKEKSCFYYTVNNSEMFDLINRVGLDYAFTLFTAGERLYPYTHTNKIYLYVKKSELKIWKEAFMKTYIRNSTEQEGNLFILPVKEEFYFKFSKKIGTTKIAPLSIVIADLISYGSIGKEQGQVLLNKFINGELNLNG